VPESLEESLELLGGRRACSPGEEVKEGVVRGI
jgi:hypothetical protein